MLRRNRKPLSGILASCSSKRKKTNKYCFGNQTKFLIFLRNNHDCMVVDPYKARKRYTVTESLDLIVSVKKRNPIRIFLNYTRFAWAGGTFFPVVLLCCVSVWFLREQGFLIYCLSVGCAVLAITTGKKKIQSSV